MTLEQRLKEMMVERGMFEEQADEVMACVKDDECNKSMQSRWKDEASGYPPAMIKVLWIFTKEAALDYIEKNLPQAWFKSMFMN